METETRCGMHWILVVFWWVVVVVVVIGIRRSR